MKGTFDRTTTIERLECEISIGEGAVLEYKHHIIAVDRGWGETYLAAVYEFYDEPEDGYDKAECRINRIAEAEECFAENGEAVKWAFEIVENL